MKIFELGFVLFLTVGACIALAAFLGDEKIKNAELQSELDECRAKCAEQTQLEKHHV